MRDDITMIDIRSEAERTYHYPNGRYAIASPVNLYLVDGRSGQTHRVVDSAGVTHRPTPGWLAISWTPVPDGPAFVA